MDDSPQGSTVCPQCGRLIGFVEPTCSYCGSARRAPSLVDAFWKMLDRAGVTRVLVAANAIAYTGSLLLTGESALQAKGSFLSILGPSMAAVRRLGVLEPERVRATGEAWTLVTSAFLHGGLIHILFNMMALYSVGRFFEGVMGPARFTILYMASALTGSAACLLSSSPVLGASGAIFGLIGAGIALGTVFARRLGPHGASIRRQFGSWAFNGLIISLLPGISWLGHGGGFVGGLLVCPILMSIPNERGREPAFLRWIGLGLLVLVPVAFALALVR